MPQRLRKKKIRTSLNLGGGSARGFAHIGILKLFEEQKIPYDMIIGISMGAFVGSIYSIEPSADFVKERFYDMMSKDAFHRSLMNSYGKNLVEASGVFKKVNKLYFQTSLLKRMLLQKGMASQEEMEENLYPLLADIGIENTRIPFATTAVCLETGVATVFTSGSIRKAVLASAALPMVFPPQQIGNYHYIDGGVLDKLGIETAKLLNIERKVVFDVSNVSLQREKIKNALDVMIRSDDIAANYRRTKQATEADLTLYPIKHNIHWADFSAIDEIIDMGYECARENVDKIRSVYNLTNPFRRIYSSLRHKIKHDKTHAVLGV